MADPHSIAGAPATADFELHFVRYRREGGGTALGWCACGWAFRGTTDAVYAASAVHDLDAAKAAGNNNEPG